MAHAATAASDYWPASPSPLPNAGRAAQLGPPSPAHHASPCAARAGAGYVSALVPGSLEQIFEIKLTEVMKLNFEQQALFAKDPRAFLENVNLDFTGYDPLLNRNFLIVANAPTSALVGIWHGCEAVAPSVLLSERAAPKFFRTWEREYLPLRSFAHVDAIDAAPRHARRR